MGFIGFVAFLVFFLYPTWRIVTKAGYHGAWSLLSLVPLVNIVMLWVFAFSNWPNAREQR
jgi:hypothetical protein